MSFLSSTMIGGAFLLIFLFVAWLKFHEHLHLHRHEHGPHTERTHPHRRIRGRSQ